MRWLVVGIGDITRRRVIPAILEEPRSHLHGVVTRDLKKAEAYPGTAAWATLDAALKDESIDAVYVASPVALHASQTISALKAGKHVLCEKPTALNYAEAQAMAEAAKETGKLLGVSYYRRLYPKLIRAKELVATWGVGQPLMAEANCQEWTERQERVWRWDPAVGGGGPLFDTASHRIDAMNFLFGKPERAMGLRSNAVQEWPVEDSATVLIGYAGGVHAVVDVRWNSHVRRDQLRIIGTEGDIVLDPLNGSEIRVNGQVEEMPPHSNLHYPIVENFVAAVEDGVALACPIEEAIWTDWVTEQVVKSAKDSGFARMTD